MEREHLEKLISEHLFFANLEPEYVSKLSEMASLVEIDKNEFIFYSKEEAKNFFVILEGLVSLQIFSHERGAINIETIGNGEFLGWSWIISPFKWHFDAKAIEKCKLISFDAKKLRKMMDQDITFGYKVYKIFTPIIIERLQATRVKLLDLYENVVLI